MKRNGMWQAESKDGGRNVMAIYWVAGNMVGGKDGVGRVMGFVNSGLICWKYMAS